MNDKQEIVVASEQQNMMTLITEALHNKDITTETLNGLLDFKERLDRRKAEIEANAAFARVVKNMPIIRKNGQIDFSSEKKGKQKPIFFAKFEDACRRQSGRFMRPKNFVVNYDSAPLENMWTKWTAIATHETGVQFRGSINLPLDTSGGKQNIQGAGSTHSSGMRYATRALFNLRWEGDDDDGVSGGMVLITDDQAAKLKDLIRETNTDTLAFLRMFEVSSVENLTTATLAPALNMLMSKKAKMVKT